MARYTGLLLAPAEGFALWPSFFSPSVKNRAYYAFLANFWCPVVTLVTCSTNLSNFERNPNKPKKSKKNLKKIQKKFKKSNNP